MAECPENMEAWTSDTGQELCVHSRGDCEGQSCPIHAPSAHPMVSFPRHMRLDRGIMERICPHAIGHPDPDDLNIRNGNDPGVHGCDGCCHE